MKFKTIAYKQKDRTENRIDYNRFENGNAEIYINLFSYSLHIYINGLKKYQRKYKRIY